MRRPRGSTLFAATLLVLVVSLLAYMTVSHAQSDQNGGAFNATAESMGDNGTLAGNGSLNIQNGTALQTPPGIIPTDNGTQDQSVQNGTPDNQSISDNGTLSGNGTTGQSVQSSGYAVSGAGYGVMDNDPTVNCPNITLPGTYTMTTINYTGAPNSASPLTGASCVRINSSNVVFDCAGHSITNNSAGQTFGILVAGPVTNVTVQNCNVFNYNYGIYYYSSNNSNILNNTANNDTFLGICLDSSSNDSLSNNIANNNYFAGIYLVSSTNSNISNNAAANNSAWAFYSISGSTRDIVENLTVGNSTVSFDSKDISIQDAPHPPPYDPPGLSDINRFVRVVSTSGTSFLFLNLSYTPADVVYMNESSLFMSEYTSGGWLIDPSAFSSVHGVDTSDKYVFANISNPQGVFGIFNGTLSIEEVNCPAISVSGNYLMPGPYIAAPTNAFPLGGKACLKINASNVVFDCAGYSIMGGGVTGTTYGALIAMANNVTLKNCNISDYAYGIYSYASNVTLLNDVSSYNAINGIYVTGSSNSVLTDNTAYNNSRDGIYLVSAYNDSLIGNSAYNNTFGYFAIVNGISIYSGHNITMINNSACDNGFGPDGDGSFGYGIYLDSSYNVNLTNNTAYTNYGDGIYLYVSNNSVLSGNSAYDNYNFNGIELYSSNNSTLCNNSANSNLASNGIRVSYSTNVTLSNNTADNNPEDGIDLLYSNQTAVSNNNLNNDSTYGLYLDYSNNNTIYNNTPNSAINGAHIFIYLSSSSWNFIYDNNASHNIWGIVLDSSSNNNTIYNNTANSNFYGITVWNSNSNAIYGDIADNDSILGIYLYGTNSNTVYNNSADNDGDDISVLYSNNITIFNNTCINASLDGIDFEFSNNSTLSNNVLGSNNNTYCDVTETCGNGIYIGYANNNTVSNNNADNNSNGIKVTSANDIGLYNNSADNSMCYGFYIDGTNRTAMYNNSANNIPGASICYSYGLILAASYHASISGFSANNDDYGIALATVNNVTLSNSSADNDGIDPRSVGAGISLSDASNSTLYNDSADNGHGDGIYIQGNGAFSLLECGNITVFNSSASNNSGDGIRFDSQGVFLLFNNLIYGNRFNNNNGTGVYLEASNNTILYNNSADNNGYDGIELVSNMSYSFSFSSNNNTIYDNSADNNNGTGIFLLSSNKTILYNNNASNNGMDGVNLTSSNGNQFYNTSASNNSWLGVSLLSSNNNSFYNLSADNNTLPGIGLQYSGNNSVYNSSASNNTNYGIALYYSNNNFLSNDVASNNTYPGIGLSYSSYNVVNANNINNNNVGIAIYYESDQNNLSNNNADNDSGAGIELVASSSQNILSNNSADNSQTGISISDTSDQNTLLNNSADNNSGIGIIIENSSDQNILYNNSANNNSYGGIWLIASNQSTLSNNTVMENGYLDLYVDPVDPYLPSNPDECQNSITNTTGSAGRPIYYSNDSVSWDSLDAAEIELCDANGSNVANAIVNGSDTLYNDGFIMYYTANATVANISSSDNAFGFDIRESDNDTYLNGSADNNGNPAFNSEGFYMYGNGFYVFDSKGVDFANSSAVGNYIDGFDIESSNSSNIAGSIASGNVIGIYLDALALGNNFINCDASGNSAWAFSSADGSTGDTAENLTLGHDIVSFDSKDININDSAHPQGYSGGSPSVEVHIYSSDGSNEKVTGISDGPAGSNDITSFGPTSNDYNGSVAYTQTPAGGAVAATIPTDITPVSDISSPQTMSGDDALSDDILLPFNVTLFGRQNDHIVISTNGFIYLSNETAASSDPSCCGQANMDSQGITQGSDYLVAGLWTDLVSDGVVSNITYGVAGTAPNRVYIISYDHNAEYDGSDTFGNNTFEIKLFENGTNSSATSAPDPTGLSDINRFVQSTANSPDSYLFLNFSYLPVDVASLNESTLFIGKYDSSGWDVTPADFSSSSGLDSYATYVFANITGFGSIFGILGGAAPSSPSTPAPIPPSPYVPSNEVPLSLSLTRAPCPANQVTVTAYSGPGTKIRLLLTSPYEGLVDQQTTGNDGTATFQLSASGTYEADGSQNGYLPGSATFTFTTCAIASPPVIPPVPSSGCTSDDQCPLVDFCNLSIGACQPVTGVCGFAANHAWSAYQCCQDADCAPSNICIVHTCEPVDLTGDKEGLVGGQGKVHATVGGQAFVNATLQIILPDGASFQTTTDANGDALLPFSFHGNYTVNLLLAGSSVKTHIIAVALPPPAAQVPTPALVQQPTNYCWVLPLIIAMILAYLAYRKWHNGKNKKKQPLKP